MTLARHYHSTRPFARLSARSSELSHTLAAAALIGPLIAVFSQLQPFLAQTAWAKLPARGPGGAAATRLPAARQPASVVGAKPRHAAHSPGRGPSPSAAADPAPVPGRPGAGPALSIGVGDGRQSARPGDLLNYTVKIHNIGETNASGLDVVQSLPAGMTLISDTKQGRARKGQVTWKINLPAGRAASFGVVGRVGRTPPELLRLATIACAAEPGEARPIVCAAHSDQLPAGAAAAARAHKSATPAGRAAGYLLVTAVLALAATLIGGLWVLARRRRTGRPLIRQVRRQGR